VTTKVDKKESSVEQSILKDWIKKISGLTGDIIRDVRACYKNYGKQGKNMPPEVRLRCRVLI